MPTSEPPPVATAVVQSETHPPADQSQPAVSGVPAESVEQGEPAATAVNGAAQPSNVDHVQDTEMSNTP